MVQPCETEFPSEWQKQTPHDSGRKVQADTALRQAMEVSGVVENKSELTSQGHPGSLKNSSSPLFTAPNPVFWLS